MTKRIFLVLLATLFAANVSAEPVEYPTNKDGSTITGVLTAALADDVLELSAESITLLARKDAIARVLNPPPEDGSPPTSVIGVAEDVPFTAAVRWCSSTTPARSPRSTGSSSPRSPTTFGGEFSSR